MDFALSPDQQLLMTSLETLLEPFRSPPSGSHGYVQYSDPLQQELGRSGFLEVASQSGYGPLDAAMLVEEIATCPMSVEAAASALVLPMIEGFEGPMAIIWSLGRPARFVSVARTVCLIQSDAVLIGTPDPDSVESVESVIAYPLATLSTVPRDAVPFTGTMAAAIRRRALIAIAAEAAGLMRAALQQAVQYAKDRELFGQRLGQFQAVQHRLAEDAQLVHACRMLAFRAAYQDDERTAATACLFAQNAIPKIIYDCHQFTGALGLTLEFPLHLWTYRLKFLQGEAGGKGEQAGLLADNVWRTARSDGLSAA